MRQPYSKLYIYHTKTYFLIVGVQKGNQYGMLRILRQDGPNLQLSEDPVTYSLQELNQLLKTTHTACSLQGGLQFVAKAFGLIGCIRFTASYYLLVVTRRAHMGTICGHKVYAVRDVSLLPLGAPLGVSQQKDSPVERKYRKLLMGVDLTRNFYFSLTYNLAATLQHNYQSAVNRRLCSQGFMGGQPASQASPPTFPASEPSTADFDSMFVWNSYLTRTLREVLGSTHWVVALIHGAWDQRRLSVLGRPVVLTLLARRSRYFAGTRFKKRGLSDQGNVANEVEVEQILDAGYDHGTGLPLITSIVQVRGSVPLYWSQQPTPLSPKPDIILQHFDPLYQATALHFEDLQERYGAPIVCLNLLKSRERRPRETLLRREMAVAIHMLNRQSGINGSQSLIHIPWDFQKHARQAGAGLLSEIASITHLTLEATGLFVHNPSTHHMLHVLGQPSAVRKIAVSRPAPAFVPHSLSHRDTASNKTDGLSLPNSAAEMSDIRQQAMKDDEDTENNESSTPKVQYQQQQQQDVSKGPTPSPSFKYDAVPNPNLNSSSSTARHGGPGCLLQQGILRTNCIDCLDRTNVVQFAYGLVAFGLQLYLLGVAESPEIDSDSSIALVLMEQYELMGNTLALQYGGSDAHSLFFQRKKGLSETSSRSKDLLTSIQRFYSNTYTDDEKQDAINLVLGNYIPGSPGQPHLWELETDAYLHNIADAVPINTTNDQLDIKLAPRQSELSSQGNTATAASKSLNHQTSIHSEQASISTATSATQQQITEAADAQSSNAKKVIGSSVSLISLSSDDEEAVLVNGAAGSTSGNVSSIDGEGSSRAVSVAGLPPEAVVLRPQADGTNDSTWTFSYLWNTLFGSSNRAAPSMPLPKNKRSSLQFFDVVLAQPCRKAIPVRLYTLGRRTNGTLVWQAVQNAFSFFWTTHDADGINGMDDTSPKKSQTKAFSAAKATALTALEALSTPLASRAATPRTRVGGKQTPRGFFPHPTLPMPHYLCAALLDSSSEKADVSKFLENGFSPQDVSHLGLSTTDSWVLVSRAAGGAAQKLRNRSGPGSQYAASLLRNAPESIKTFRPSQHLKRTKMHSTSGSPFATAASPFASASGAFSSRFTSATELGWTHSASRKAALASLIKLGMRYSCSLLVSQPPGIRSTAPSQATSPRASTDPYSPRLGTPKLSTKSSMAQSTYNLVSQEAFPQGFTFPTEMDQSHMSLSQAGGSTRLGPVNSSQDNLVAASSTPAAALQPGSACQTGRKRSTHAHAGCLPSFWDPEIQLAMSRLCNWDQHGWMYDPDDLGVTGVLTLWLWGFKGNLLPVDHIVSYCYAPHVILPPAGSPIIFLDHYDDSHQPLGTHYVHGTQRQQQQFNSPTISERVMSMLFKAAPSTPRLLASGNFWPSRKSISGNPTAIDTSSQKRASVSGALTQRRASMQGFPTQSDLQATDATSQTPRLISRAASYASFTGIPARAGSIPSSRRNSYVNLPGYGASQTAVTAITTTTPLAGNYGPAYAGAVYMIPNTPTAAYHAQLMGLPYNSPQQPQEPLTTRASLQPSRSTGPPSGGPPQSGNANTSTTNNGPANGGSMAALGRYPVGIGPKSVTSGGSGLPPVQTRAAGSRMPSQSGATSPSGSKLWNLADMMNPSNLMAAISQLGGSQSSSNIKPPIPLLNDFIEIGPQAQQTLTNRKLQASGGLASASNSSISGIPPAAFRQSLSVRTRNPGSVTAYNSFVSGIQKQGPSEPSMASGLAPATGSMMLDSEPDGDASWVCLDTQAASAMNAPPAVQHAVPNALDNVIGLSWSGPLGGWLPHGSSIASLVSPAEGMLGQGQGCSRLDPMAEAAWKATSDQDLSGLLALYLGGTVGNTTPCFANNATEAASVSHPGLPSWSDWATAPIPAIGTACKS